MNRRIVVVFFLLVLPLGPLKVFGQEPTPTASETPGVSPTIEATENPTPTPGETIRIPKPILLKGSERLGDSDYLLSPNAPRKGPDGIPWKVEADDHTPRGTAMANLEDPAFFNQIGDWNKTEVKPKVYYWHDFNGTPYCHFRDRSGNHWYGWAEGTAFRWALYRSGRFWWHDDYAERSLYFDRGYWWWQGHEKDQYQVYLEDGHYHVCGADGVLGEDLFTTGTEEVATQPVEKEVTPAAKADDSSMPSAGTGTGMGTGFGH
jgi:hypothetical protein